MNSDRSIFFSSLAVALAYIGGYIHLKCACYSGKQIPSDPWKSSGLSTHSKVSYWGEWDLATMSHTLSYRDPGIDVGPRFSKFINTIYHPLQKIDERNGGRSLRFNTSPHKIAW